MPFPETQQPQQHLAGVVQCGRALAVRAGQGVKGQPGGMIDRLVQQPLQPLHGLAVGRQVQDRGTDSQRIQEAPHHVG